MVTGILDYLVLCDAIPTTAMAGMATILPELVFGVFEKNTGRQEWLLNASSPTEMLGQPNGGYARGGGQSPAALSSRFLMAYGPFKLRFFEPLDDRN